MEKLIKWLENDYNSVISKLKENINNSIDLEADVVINNRILAPSTAVELAEIFEEELNIIAVLESFEVNLPSGIKETIIELCKENLTSIIELAEVESNKNGNLAICINSVVKKVPVSNGMFNFNKNMIKISFNPYGEEIKGSV